MGVLKPNIRVLTIGKKKDDQAQGQQGGQHHQQGHHQQGHHQQGHHQQGQQGHGLYSESSPWSQLQEFIQRGTSAPRISWWWNAKNV